MQDKIRQPAIFGNKRRSYVFSTDGGKTWELTMGWQEGQKPRGEVGTSTIHGLELEDALNRARMWVAGEPKAKIVMGVAV